MTDELDSADTSAPTDEGAEAPEKGSPEEAASQIENLTQRLKDTQRKVTDLGNEKAELNGKLQVFQDVVPKPQTEAAPNIWADIDEEELALNPGMLIPKIQESQTGLVTEVAQVVRQLRDELLAKIEGQNPERLAMADRIEELKQDPDLKGFNDAALLAIAKRDAKNAPAKEEEEDVIASPASGNHRRTQANAKDVKESPLWNQIYGDRFKEEGE